MVNKEMAKLYKGIWSIANDLRGAIDGWDFKQYIFGIMFLRKEKINKVYDPACGFRIIIMTEANSQK